MNILTSLPLFLIDYRTINLEMGLAATVMEFWQKRKSKLVHDYSLVGYILSPNPTIMAHAIDNKTLEHDVAAERLITKLLLNPACVGNERTIQRARLIDTFMEEYGDFTNRRSVFGQDNMWIMAADDHSRHTVGITSILINKQRCWANLHASCSPRFWASEQLRGTGSRSRP